MRNPARRPNDNRTGADLSGRPPTAIGQGTPGPASLISSIHRLRASPRPASWPGSHGARVTGGGRRRKRLYNSSKRQSHVGRAWLSAGAPGTPPNARGMTEVPRHGDYGRSGSPTRPVLVRETPYRTRRRPDSGRREPAVERRRHCAAIGGLRRRARIVRANDRHRGAREADLG